MKCTLNVAALSLPALFSVALVSSMCVAQAPPPTFNVQVTNFPDTHTVDGTVSVDNFPDVQTVDGTVNVGNLPSTQTVDGSVSVDNFPSVQTVDGTVNVGNFPQTQTVQGSVTVTNAPQPPQYFFRQCSNTVGDSCDLSIDELHDVGLVHLTYVSGSASGSANVDFLEAQLMTDTFGSVQDTLMTLPTHRRVEDSFFGGAIGFSQSMDVVWPPGQPLFFRAIGADSVSVDVFGYVEPFASTASAVASLPEPSSATLLASLALLLPFRRRLQRCV